MVKALLCSQGPPSLSEVREQDKAEKGQGHRGSPGEEGACRGKASQRWVHLSRAWKDGDQSGQQSWGI